MFGFRVRLHNPKSEFPNRTQPKLCGGARGGGGQTESIMRDLKIVNSVDIA